jgi:hypothetical protein
MRYQTMTDLSTDILIHIFSMLYGKDILSARAVCKRWEGIFSQVDWPSAPGPEFEAERVSDAGSRFQNCFDPLILKIPVVRYLHSTQAFNNWHEIERYHTLTLYHPFNMRYPIIIYMMHHIITLHTNIFYHACTHIGIETFTQELVRCIPEYISPESIAVGKILELCLIQGTMVEVDSLLSKLTPMAIEKYKNSGISFIYQLPHYYYHDDKWDESRLQTMYQTLIRYPHLFDPSIRLINAAEVFTRTTTATAGWIGESWTEVSEESMTLLRQRMISIIKSTPLESRKAVLPRLISILDNPDIQSGYRHLLCTSSLTAVLRHIRYPEDLLCNFAIQLIRPDRWKGVGIAGSAREEFFRTLFQYTGTHLGDVLTAAVIWGSPDIESIAMALASSPSYRLSGQSKYTFITEAEERATVVIDKWYAHPYYSLRYCDPPTYYEFKGSQPSNTARDLWHMVRIATISAHDALEACHV